MCYLVALTALSQLGSFGGTGLLPAPYDSLTVAALALALFFWAVRSGVRYLAVVPAPAPVAAE